MAKYFNISTGLRGGYMADSAYIVRCDTRKALKDIIASEARDYKDAGFVGSNKRAIAHIAAISWRNAHAAKPAYLPYALPLAPSHGRDNYCHGIFVANASRSEFLEYERECDN